MSNPRQSAPITQDIIEEAGRCELCGSKRSLEVHHIIPVSCGGDNSRDNLLCVCRRCHATLTPHSLLTKIGLDKAKYGSMNKKLKVMIYEKIQNDLESSDKDPLDIVYEAIETILV